LKYKQTKRLKKALVGEKQVKIYSLVTYKKFMQRIEKTRRDLLSLIKKIKSKGKSIWIYGASTKGNTILQYCGIGKKDIDAAADANPFKIGKYIIDSDIPIKTEDEMHKVKPDYLLTLPYSFVDNFRKREIKLVKENETKFIVPLPKVDVI